MPVVAHLTARIASLEPREQGVRVVLDEVRSGALPIRRRAGCGWRCGRAATFHPGQWLSLTAQLDTPPAPSEPGANDLGRSLFFQSIGAVGFAYGKARVIVPARAAQPWASGSALAIEDLRLAMTSAIQAALPGSTGGIASALITGERGGISDEDEEALRDAGLAHVLAIAGLHMALVGGGIFWLLRAVLAAIPALALHYPDQEMGGGGRAGGGRLLSGDQRGCAVVGAGLCHAGHGDDGDAAGPARRCRCAAWPWRRRSCWCCGPKRLPSRAFRCRSRRWPALVAVAEWEMRRERSHAARHAVSLCPWHCD